MRVWGLTTRFAMVVFVFGYVNIPSVKGQDPVLLQAGSDSIDAVTVRNQLYQCFFHFTLEVGKRCNKTRADAAVSRLDIAIKKNPKMLKVSEIKKFAMLDCGDSYGSGAICERNICTCKDKTAFPQDKTCGTLRQRNRTKNCEKEVVALSKFVKAGAPTTIEHPYIVFVIVLAAVIVYGFISDLSLQLDIKDPSVESKKTDSSSHTSPLRSVATLPIPMVDDHHLPPLYSTSISYPNSKLTMHHFP